METNERSRSADSLVREISFTVGFARTSLSAPGVTKNGCAHPWSSVSLTPPFMGVHGGPEGYLNPFKRFSRSPTFNHARPRPDALSGLASAPIGVAKYAHWRFARVAQG